MRMTNFSMVWFKHFDKHIEEKKSWGLAYVYKGWFRVKPEKYGISHSMNPAHWSHPVGWDGNRGGDPTPFERGGRLGQMGKTKWECKEKDFVFNNIFQKFQRHMVPQIRGRNDMGWDGILISLPSH